MSCTELSGQGTINGPSPLNSSTPFSANRCWISAMCARSRVSTVMNLSPGRKDFHPLASREERLCSSPGLALRTVLAASVTIGFPLRARLRHFNSPCRLRLEMPQTHARPSAGFEVMQTQARDLGHRETGSVALSICPKKAAWQYRLKPRSARRSRSVRNIKARKCDCLRLETRST